MSPVRRIAVLATAAATLAPAQASPDADPPGPLAAPPGRPRFLVHMSHDERTTGLVSELLAGAYERLGRARCQGVFSEFRDESGRPLRDRLQSLALDGQGYLGFVVFHDGRRQSRCGRKGTLAVTSPGSRVVSVCPDALRDLARRNARVAEAILIHEVLHTLGLGENPPSSTDITARVLRLCSH